MTHLDGTGDGNLVVNTTAFPTAYSRSPAITQGMLRRPQPSVADGGQHRVLSMVGPSPCPRDPDGGFERPSSLARKTEVADTETARRTFAGRLTGDQISGPEPDVQRSVATLRSLFPPSALVFLRHLRQRRTPGRFSKWNGSPAAPQCGQPKPSPQRASPGRRRRPRHRGKVAGTRVASAGMGDRRGRQHPWRAPLYPVCAHSSPSGVGVNRIGKGRIYLRRCGASERTRRN